MIDRTPEVDGIQKGTRLLLEGSASPIKDEPSWEVLCPLLVLADMAELADALDSGSSDRKVVEVQVLLSALGMAIQPGQMARLSFC
jgi:hypothetical protein